jgi:hypothetical protein
MAVTVAPAVAAAVAEAAVAAAIAVGVAAMAEAAVATAVAVAAGEAVEAAAVAAAVGSGRGSGRGSSSAAAIATATVLAVAAAEASVAAGVKLLATGNPEMIDTSPLTAPKELTAITLEAPPMSVLEPTEIEPKQDAHKPLPISKPLLPTLAVPLLNNRSSVMPPVPVLFHTAMLLSMWLVQRLMKLGWSRPRQYYHHCHQLSQLLRLCHHLPRSESSCWLMVIQKR